MRKHRVLVAVLCRACMVFMVGAVCFVAALSCNEEECTDGKKASDACEEIRSALQSKLDACESNGHTDNVQIMQCNEVCDTLGIIGGLGGCMADAFTQNLVEDIDAIDEGSTVECQQLNDNCQQVVSNPLLQIAEDYDWCG